MKSHCYKVYKCTPYALITTFACIYIRIYVYIYIYYMCVCAYFNDAYSVHAVGVLSYVDYL